ncbi:SsgA family sporulation/cell division regulator [Streptomyces sp. NPDC059861]|uniref:SsgA family sporulation/cell division regulator n=1 Tax=Streptomyces sp. NPDC059861 TaxID=3346974 RepID=UPI003666C520
MESTRTTEIDLPVQLVRSFTESVPVRMRLHYAAHDPYALTATFGAADGSGSVEWVFSRDVIAEGLTRHAGQGDVRVWPAAIGPGRDVVYIALDSPAGSALLEAPLLDMKSFLSRTRSMVPLGAESEQFDMDAELAHLLADS